MRRIGNAVVVDAFQRLNETVANLFEISEGKAAIVQMAVHHPLLQKFIHPFCISSQEILPMERVALSTMSARLTIPVSLLCGLGPL